MVMKKVWRRFISWVAVKFQPRTVITKPESTYYIRVHYTLKETKVRLNPKSKEFTVLIGVAERDRIVIQSVAKIKNT